VLIDLNPDEAAYLLEVMRSRKSDTSYDGRDRLRAHEMASRLECLVENMERKRLYEYSCRKLMRQDVADCGTERAPVR
jgi:hypothetical protein